ncbi:MAG: hypothetical protein AB1Z23_00045 [Eubacteriales bacterium]
MEKLKIVKSDIENIRIYLDEHLSSLSFPIDSYIEDIILASQKYEIIFDGIGAGYFSVQEETLSTFYVTKHIYAKAPDILEYVVNMFKIEKVIVLSQDPQINALMMEWDTEIQRMGCFFTDSGNPIENNVKLKNASFRNAVLTDTKAIHEVCGDFFDEPSCGYNSLEDRISDSTIFILEESGVIYGCGIIERSILMPENISIGMYTNPEYRNMGAAKTILINLKKIAYNSNRKPVAGCWYYNTLSRRSLESAGMIASSLGYYAKIIKKDKPPKRTGNPPGILVK